MFTLNLYIVKLRVVLQVPSLCVCSVCSGGFRGSGGGIGAYARSRTDAEGFSPREGGVGGRGVRLENDNFRLSNTIVQFLKGIRMKF